MSNTNPSSSSKSIFVPSSFIKLLESTYIGTPFTSYRSSVGTSCPAISYPKVGTMVNSVSLVARRIPSTSVRAPRSFVISWAAPSLTSTGGGSLRPRRLGGDLCSEW
eukprot:TRINITY_DN1739_c0_g1_i3.p1 TRINITY_DN1739_c0_g1~~TRINITY_DN1739_c0_g1_i3.p1  ORF type:complete len:107 (+),score=3.70 TRINITY_DN1739_c0_g1_i3:382-702(+)